MKNIWRYLLLGSGVTLLSIYLHRKYLQEKEQMLQKWQQGSQTIMIPGGEVEYAIAGSGPPLLFVHGGFGGYEQGVMLAPLLFPQYQLITLSRPGHRRTVRSSGSPSRWP